MAMHLVVVAPDGVVRERLVIPLHQLTLLQVQARQTGTADQLLAITPGPTAFPFRTEQLSALRHGLHQLLATPAVASAQRTVLHYLIELVEVAHAHTATLLVTFDHGRCPVCGVQLDFEPWTEDQPSDEICPQCGIQFGYDDVGTGTARLRKQIYDEWRQRWLSSQGERGDRAASSR